MSKRTVKEIQRKAEAWQTAEMITGIYRLFIYLDWEDIPNKYRKFFKEEAEELWKKEGASSIENIEEDINIVINNILLELSKGNIILSLPLIPPILADIFMLGKGTDRLQATFMTIIRDFLDTSKFDTQFAKITAAIQLGDFLKKLAKTAGIKLNVNIDNTMEAILTSGIYELSEEPAVSTSIMADVDKALEEYEQRKLKEEEVDARTSSKDA